MNILPTKIPDLLILEPKVFGDQRGFFQESYHQQRYVEHGITEHFVQDNHSRSKRGVLRGLHYQLERPQAKLVTVLRGRVFDVAVDMRASSDTFGQWVGVMLDDIDHHQFYIPEGFAHGFCVLSEIADFCYKCSDYYDPKSERGIIWNDPKVRIDWPIENPELSEKDRAYPSIQDMPETDFFR